MNGIHAFAGRDVSGLASLAVLRPRELQLRSRLAVRQEVGLHQEPPVLAPGAQTSSLQSDENPACVVSAGWSAALLQRPAPRHAGICQGCWVGSQADCAATLVTILH